MPYQRMSHFPEVYPFSLFPCAVTYVKKTVRKNNFVTFDIQLLQEKAKEVHLCFSVITKRSMTKKACITLGFEGTKEADMSQTVMTYLN